jgi:hypothetical protein
MLTNSDAGFLSKIVKKLQLANDEWLLQKKKISLCST